MSEQGKESTSPIARTLLYGISLFNVYLYTVLSLVLMQVWGLPYLTLSETQLAKDALLMALPLLPPTFFALRKLDFSKMNKAGAKWTMFRFMGLLILCVGFYCFVFLYFNINYAPRGHQLCSGEIVKKRRVRIKNGISHRVIVHCDVGDGDSFRVEKRVSEGEYEYLSVGELQPLTYIKGLFGVDLLVKHQESEY